jgi:hypothetical protein
MTTRPAFLRGIKSCDVITHKVYSLTKRHGDTSGVSQICIVIAKASLFCKPIWARSDHKEQGWMVMPLNIIGITIQLGW